MDNTRSRAPWSTQYSPTNLRTPNLDLLGVNSNPADNSTIPQSSFRLSIDAPEFVPNRIKTGQPTISLLGQQVPQSEMSRNDPAIILHGNSYPMAGGYSDHRLNNMQPSQQFQQQPQQSAHSHHHMHSQHQPHAHQNNMVGSVGGGKPDHRYASVQNRLNVAGGSNSSSSGGGPGRSDFNGDLYGQSSMSSQQQQSSEPVQTIVTEKENNVLNYLSEVTHTLTDNPGMFEEIQRQLTNMFFDFSYNQFVMSNAVEMIFELSVDEQNFRYMGARLCRLLDSVETHPNSVFRTLLCLKMDDHQSKLQSFIINEKRKVRGTTLFLAELYMQMQNDGARIMKIAQCIVNAMSMLLQIKGPENVKCICQALKLCGYELELDRPEDIQRITRELKSLENTLDVSTERLLKSVLDLKSNRWGRSEPVVMQPILDTIHQDYNDAPVFYGPDGQVLTDEENSFLLSNIPSYPTLNYEDYDGNDPDELVEAEPEMDLEIQMAFKDFVKSAKNKQL